MKTRDKGGFMYYTISAICLAASLAIIAYWFVSAAGLVLEWWSLDGLSFLERGGY